MRRHYGRSWLRWSATRSARSPRSARSTWCRRCPRPDRARSCARRCAGLPPARTSRSRPPSTMSPHSRHCARYCADRAELGWLGGDMGGGWGKSAALAARRMGAVTALGALLGLLVGGVGGRLAMMLLARLNPEATGVTSDDGFTMGQFTLSDTVNLLLLGTLLGVVGAGVYVLLRGLRIGPRWFQILCIGAGPAVVIGALIVHPDGSTFGCSSRPGSRSGCSSQYPAYTRSCSLFLPNGHSARVGGGSGRRWRSRPPRWSCGLARPPRCCSWSRRAGLPARACAVPGPALSCSAIPRWAGRLGSVWPPSSLSPCWIWPGTRPN